MIKTIELRNFQAHKSTSLNFSEGVNIIKGPSHNGKTAIIRALRWALTNKPGGESFKSWFVGNKEPVSVAVEFDDGYVIRNRSSGKNGYKLKHNGEEALELNAVGRDLPEEVSKLTRMSDLNLQSQHDGYFMLQESAASALQKLNQIVGLTVIDETLKAANQKNHRLLSELRSTETHIGELDTEIAQLDYIEFAGKVIDKISELIKEKESCTKLGVALNNLLLSIQSTEEEIELCDNLLEIETDYEEAKMTIRHLRSIENQKSELIGVYNDTLRYSREIREHSKKLEAEPAVNALLVIANKITKIRSERVSLERTCQSIQNLRTQQNQAKEELFQAENDYEEMLLEAGVCPLCGQQIVEEEHTHESEDNQDGPES